MPYVSLTAAEERSEWEVRAYLDDNRVPKCHITLVTRSGGVHFALIVSAPEAMDLMEAARRAIEDMRDLDSHPALAERD